jgi:hypothetical protein
LPSEGPTGSRATPCESGRGSIAIISEKIQEINFMKILFEKISGKVC